MSPSTEVAAVLASIYQMLATLSEPDIEVALSCLRGWSAYLSPATATANAEPHITAKVRNAEPQRNRKSPQAAPQKSAMRNRSGTANRRKSPQMRNRSGAFASEGGEGGVSFEQFWSLYPKKRDRKDAERIWIKLHPDQRLGAIILAAVKQQATWDDWQKDGGKFVPYPSTWLNGRRWEDEGTASGTASGTAAGPQEHPDAYGAKWG